MEASADRRRQQTVEIEEIDDLGHPGPAPVMMFPEVEEVEVIEAPAAAPAAAAPADNLPEVIEMQPQQPVTQPGRTAAAAPLWEGNNQQLAMPTDPLLLQRHFADRVQVKHKSTLHWFVRHRPPLPHAPQPASPLEKHLRVPTNLAPFPTAPLTPPPPTRARGGRRTTRPSPSARRSPKSSGVQ